MKCFKRFYKIWVYLHVWYSVWKPFFFFFFLELTFLAEWWCGLDIKFYGTKEDFDKLGKETAICLCNHRSDVDWLLGYTLAERAGVLAVGKWIIFVLTGGAINTEAVVTGLSFAICWNILQSKRDLMQYIWGETLVLPDLIDTSAPPFMFSHFQTHCHHTVITEQSAARN